MASDRDPSTARSRECAYGSDSASFRSITDSSISVLQWLLNADSTAHSPTQRLTKFFTTLHACLRNPSRAVFQFYPSSDDQVHMITQAAQRAGFGGGIVVDYPNSRKARKMYLCLMVGQQEIPKGLDGEEMGVGDKARLKEEVRNESRRRKDKTTGGKKKKGKTDISAKDWVLKKKALYRVRGKEGYVVMPTDPLHAGADIAVCLRTPSSRRESEGFSFDLWQGRYFRFHFITILCMHLTT